jgi:hypothetical protein
MNNINEYSIFDMSQEEKDNLRNMYLTEIILARDEIKELIVKLRNTNKDEEKRKISISLMLAHHHIKIIQLSLFDVAPKNKNIELEV